MFCIKDDDLESLRWFRGVGIEFERKQWSGRKRRRFIEMERIDQILISEVRHCSFPELFLIGYEHLRCPFLFGFRS